MKRFYDDEGNLTECHHTDGPYFEEKIYSLYGDWIKLGYNRKDFYQMLAFYASIAEYNQHLERLK